MSRTLLLATALALTSSAAFADHDVVKWEGVMQLVGKTSQCGDQSNKNWRSRYHPRLNPGDPNSSFTRRFEDTRIELITNTSGNAQFSGTGGYSLVGIGGGEVINQPNSTYSFTQTPTTVLTTTPFVSLTGSLNNYSGISGCTLTIRAVYVRVDPEQDP